VGEVSVWNRKVKSEAFIRFSTVKFHVLQHITGAIFWWISFCFSTTTSLCKKYNVFLCHGLCDTLDLLR